MRIATALWLVLALTTGVLAADSDYRALRRQLEEAQSEREASGVAKAMFEASG